MENEERLKSKFEKLSKTIAGIPSKFSGAIQDGLQEDNWQLTCVQQKLLNFDLVEKDIAEIHKKLTKSGDTVLGSRIVIDDREDFIEILTYVKRKDNIFSASVKSAVRRVTNIPSDILEELKSKGRVELSVKI